MDKKLIVANCPDSAQVNDLVAESRILDFVINALR